MCWRIHCGPVQLLARMEGSSCGARILSRLNAVDLLAQRARTAGVPVLALTDRLTSPLAPWVPSPCMPTPTAGISPTPKPAVLALINALGSAVAHGAKDSVKAAAQLAEAMLLWLHSAAPARFRAIKNAGKPLSRKPAAPSKLPKILL